MQAREGLCQDGQPHPRVLLQGNRLCTPLTLHLTPSCPRTSPISPCDSLSPTCPCLPPSPLLDPPSLIFWSRLVHPLGPPGSCWASSKLPSSPCWCSCW